MKKNLIVVSLIFLSAIGYASYYGYTTIKSLQSDKSSVQKQLTKVKADLNQIKSRDEYKINVDLQKQVKNVESGYSNAVKVYEKLHDLKNHSKNTQQFDEQFTDILTLLSKLNYSSAEAAIKALDKDIADEKAKIAASFQIPVNVKESNTPPGAGFASQVVKNELGEFLVYIVAADLNSTRVIVDTASDEDCKNDCPVLSLGDYVSRSGAYAGINGSYFCPADYPSCSDKKNSYDTLAMNKNKKYINSDNNVYSMVPAVIFSGNSARFVGQSLEWGRDTGVDAVLAMQPLLVSGGNIVFTGDGEPKRGSKGSRSFVGTSGSTVYIGVVFNATVAEAAYVIHSLGIQNALNLDDGGSTALWSGGYKAGPGRNLPNALLFVGK
ncbi:MAG: hypothetical protein US40_C0012G0028 [Candidatus Roizmanbacteria bacterium GW2011_GWC2_37_13]|uniref:Phosphodiester glycosidase domain-containing protein n=1 Tax=Candidatus Roizmanbacteria bacterium GW2011_GWC2_37_13 TaxID=1618486 RepID=A0A0G0G1M1_9BACT|nr:MAG: hypothetical protein US38_C0008G0002 [Candidatus Roizmanbacteria bacterium GW2011_GWC1_37_12]KKQ25093.1 MAG: hypothetical protein US40_C0012G0028 [Candidatus Roizmanbacteria bacterium GW2011_GWC2_37_13]